MALSLGQAIRQLRVSASLSQNDLAKRAGVEKSYLSHLEADHREPSIRLLRKLASALDVPPGLLFLVAISIDLPDAQRELLEALLPNLLKLASLQTNAGSFSD
jgi:transcriptional regulator with XRE-family HTH domain